MAVSLTKNYGSFTSGQVVAFPADVETALIAQGFGTAATGVPVQSWNTSNPNGYLQNPTFGGNMSIQPGGGIIPSTVPQGPRILPNGPILAFASLGTNTTLVAGTIYRCEIYVPHYATWTGISVLNGATVGTNNGLVALYDSNGVFIQSSAVAGAVTAGANTWQDRAFLATVSLPPGRYFVAYQANGTTDTLRTWAAANGGNQMTSSATGTFGTVSASFTAPTTFTADVGPIARLYQ